MVIIIITKFCSTHTSIHGLVHALLSNGMPKEALFQSYSTFRGSLVATELRVLGAVEIIAHTYDKSMLTQDNAASCAASHWHDADLRLSNRVSTGTIENYAYETPHHAR
jgi:hypothetical protein